MMPGMNPRMMKQAMKKMGMKQEELDVQQIIMKMGDKEVVFENPQVSKVNMMGQDTYQVVGECVERAVSSEPDINEDDVKTVMEQTGVSEDVAKETIEKNNGDLAASIMELSENKDQIKN